MANGKSSGNGVTNRDLYDAVNGLRTELGGAVQRLDDKFTSLEAGRLTRAEGNISDLRIEIQKMLNSVDAKIDSVKQAGGTLSTKFTIIWSLAGAIIVAVVTAAAYRLIVGANVK